MAQQCMQNMVMKMLDYDQWMCMGKFVEKCERKWNMKFRTVREKIYIRDRAR